MIEETVLHYLAGTLAVPVRMEIPADPPASFVVVEKTAGGQSNHIYSAMLAIQSYAGSLFSAASLNEQVKAAMAGIIELPEISDCRLNSDYNFTDTATKRYRYQAVFDIIHY